MSKEIIEHKIKQLEHLQQKQETVRVLANSIGSTRLKWLLDGVNKDIISLQEEIALLDKS